MTILEHYFENLLFHGKDIQGEPNKNFLSSEQQDTIEECVNYILTTIFDGREDFLSYVHKSNEEDIIHKRLKKARKEARRFKRKYVNLKNQHNKIKQDYSYIKTEYNRYKVLEQMKGNPS